MDYSELVYSTSVLAESASNKSGDACIYTCVENGKMWHSCIQFLFNSKD